MDPITTAAATTNIPLTEIMLQLIAAVGVGNFLLIVIVLTLVVNAPTIIKTVVETLSKNKANKALNKSLSEIHTVVDSISSCSVKLEAAILDLKNGSEYAEKNLIEAKNEIKNLMATVNLLHKSIEKENNERREENILITSTLETLSRALDSINRMMRNVISEDDTSRLLSFILGIEPSLKNNIVEKVMSTMEKCKEINESLERDLTNDLNSEWSDFKNQINQFNTPIKVPNLINEYESKMWQEKGMYYEILKIATDRTIDLHRKKEIISKLLNFGLRKLHNDLADKMLEIKNDAMGVI